jgi:hypothetical protein
MSYYNSVLRASEGYAARVAEELWPRAATRRAVCRLLADTLRFAERHTSAWMLTLNPDCISVNVGPVRLMALSKEWIWMVACSSSPRLRLPRWISDQSDRRVHVYSAVKVPSRQYEIAPGRIRDLPAAFRRAALEYVEEAASRRRRASLWARSHSTGLIRFLNSYLGESLPVGEGGEGEVKGLSDSEALEGRLTKALRMHRTREQKLRAVKLRQALLCSPDNRLRCEVPRCGFDFEAVYGRLGRGYAQVHHLTPLAETDAVITRLEGLVVVCANCHAMIHRGGKCRPITGLGLGKP